jgi:hypothetical protein
MTHITPNPSYPLNINLNFQNKIGSAIRKQNEGSIEKLIFEVETKLNSSLPENNRTFYENSLGLLTASLTAITLHIHEKAADSGALHSINTKILDWAEKESRVCSAIHKTLHDPDLHIQHIHPCTLDNIPHKDLFIKPAQESLEKAQTALKTELDSADLWKDVKHSVENLKKGFAEFHGNLVQTESTNLANARKKAISTKIEAADNDFPFTNEFPPEILENESYDELMENVITGDYDRHRVPDAAFIEAGVPPDGDCGFHALNISRDEVVDHLNANSNNAVIRKQVAPEVFAWLTENEGLEPKIFDDPFLSDYQEEFLENQTAIDERLDHWIDHTLGGSPPAELGLNRIETISKWPPHKFANLGIPPECQELLQTRKKLIDELNNDPRYYTKYIEQYYEQGGYLRTPYGNETGVLSVIADIKNISIRLWKPSLDTPHTVEMIHEIKKDNGQVPVEMILRGAHYNKLLPLEVIPTGSIDLHEQKRFEDLV